MPPPTEDTARYAVLAPDRMRIHKRQGPTDQVLPGPPPVYTPTIPLHASIVPYTDLPSSTAIAPGNSGPAPGGAPQTLHGANIGLLVGAVVACSALLLLVGILVWYTLRRKACKLRAAHPRFSMFLPNPRLSAISQKTDSTWGNARPRSAANEGGQFVFVSTSEEDVAKNEKHDEEGTPPLAVLKRIGSAFVSDATMRRHSSPAILEDFDAEQWLSASTSEPTRPLSLPPLVPNDRQYIQRQKAKEIAQMMRMRIIGHEPTRHDAQLHALQRNSLLAAHRRSMPHGLGIVHEVEEVESPRSALCGYGRSASSPPAMTLNELFDVDSNGEIVRLSMASMDSPASTASPGMPPTPSALLANEDDNASIHSSDSSLEEHELKSAVVIRAGRARSMEFKRPILISVHTTSAVFISPPASRSAPLLTSPQVSSSPGVTLVDTNASTSTISAFPSPPPMLGPIMMSPTAFAEDVSQSIQERMFTYRGDDLSGEGEKKMVSILRGLRRI
ncbi:hypothetical protein EIP86_009086 [Pleurotus ostreatoroseus]|nr:hypothetical protein EIP86_009086 [Pleurotus ostreatoroseus]